MAQATRAGWGWAERFERLAQLVPGLGRYQDREGLRETDKQVRSYLADQLADLGRILEGAPARLAESKRLERLPALDRLARRLAALSDRVRYASYGFIGVFDFAKIREAELSSLHRFDLNLLDAIDPAAPGAPRRRRGGSCAGGGLRGGARAAGKALDDFERSVAERERLVRGL